jgi:hypothetical protein
MKLGWYLRRLGTMEAGEIAWRVRNAVLQFAWRRWQGDRWPTAAATPQWAGGRVPRITVSAKRIDALRANADAILAGRWQIFGAEARIGGARPDWFWDPLTSRKAPSQAFCFDIPFREEQRAGNIKFVWELSRLHHMTLLAAAYHCTGDTRYADHALAHLRFWWRANPPLVGIHWVSGIELGLRLIAWVWIRRLLDDYPGVADAFEQNATFHRQLHAHQSWISRFRCRGSSANNHLIAEMAGLFVAAQVFPLFKRSACWAAFARQSLEREVARQTFSDGLNRELASDYHTFVLELLLVAGVEADAAGAQMSEAYWSRLRDMADAIAGTVDTRCNVARQGDSDDGRALVLEPPNTSRVETMLALCGHLFGPAKWWPQAPQAGITAALLAATAKLHNHLASPRATIRPNSFPEAGVVVIRDLESRPDEIWCYVDAGPHGFLATSAHAHADSLSFELRIGGQPVLVDPGTYCYHGETLWRDYFRSTVAHNTLELDGCSQAVLAGPFLWLTHPTAHITHASGLDHGDVAVVQAFHDGYLRPPHKTIHHRRLTLNRRTRTLELLDWVESDRSPSGRLAFHLHPKVSCELAGCTAHLAWSDGVRRRSTLLSLPPTLTWTTYRGEVNPTLGWYSPSFGCKEPTTMLLGTGRIAPGTPLRTEIALSDLSLVQEREVRPGRHCESEMRPHNGIGVQSIRADSSC